VVSFSPAQFLNATTGLVGGLGGLDHFCQNFWFQFGNHSVSP
jgi:hypothetical protein